MMGVAKPVARTKPHKAGRRIAASR